MKAFFTVFLLAFFFQLYPVFGQNLTGVKIYINPGHGGYDSDDRNVVIPPFAAGDPNGFWESVSNLDKGLHLRDLLQAAGAEVIMSRVLNRTVDDRPLSAIAEEANVNNSDFMISIHSNAHTGAVNYPLMLFHGWDNNPILPASLDLANLFWENLISNQIAHWTYTSRSVRGDKSFAPESWNGYGVLRPLTVPGLISEGSFHDYIPETYRLMNIDYKKLEAWHFYKAFVQYFNGTPDTKGKIAGYVKDSFSKVTAYYVAPGSKDQWLPVNGATVTLNPGNIVYNLDNLNNGAFVFHDLNPGTYQLTFEATKYQQKVVENIEVFPNKVTYYLCALDQDRSDPLKVLSHFPAPAAGELVSAATTISFNFNFEVDRASFESAFSILPATSGTFVYSDQDRTASFVPSNPLEKSTLYTVTLDKSARHIGNLSMDEDYSFTFTTRNRNRLEMVDAFPFNQSTHIFPSSQVKLHFDWKLKNLNLSTLIGFIDAQGNPVPRSTIEVNTLPGDVGTYAFRYSALTPGAKYFLNLNRNIEDESGLTLGEDITIEFNVISVPVPDASIVYSFEDAVTDWTVDEAKSMNIIVGAATRILRYSTIKLFGSYSYRLLYAFYPGEAHVVVNYANSGIQMSTNDYLGLYVGGDLSHNQLLALFEGESGLLEIPFTTIDFAGWQLRGIRLTGLPDDGLYTFKGFKMKSGETPFSVSGVVLFDNLLWSMESITSLPDNNNIDNRNIIIAPNPVVNDINLYTNLKVNDTPYQIIAIDGRVVQTGIAKLDNGWSQIPVSSLLKGVYFLIINNGSEKHQTIFRVN